MIHISSKVHDLSFVADIIRRRSLSPQPLPDYHERPGAWDESLRYLRTVEAYAWGQIIFLSNRAANLHATVVVEGADLDLVSGMVKDRAGQADQLIPVEWYADLSREFDARVAPVAALRVPECLGFHERDVVCDGGYNPQGQIEKPCSWRTFCIPFQAHCASEGRNPKELSTNIASHELVRLVARLKDSAATVAPPMAEPIPAERLGSAEMALQRYRAGLGTTNSGKMTGRLSKAQRPGRACAPNGNGPTVAAAKVAGSVQMRMVAEFWTGLQDRLGPRPFRMTQEGAKPGEVFQRDRVFTSAYITLMVQGAKRFPDGLAQIRIRASSIGIQLPLPVDHPLLAPVQKHVIGWKDGPFLCELKPIPDGVRIDQALDIIEKAVKTKAIKLTDY